MCTILTFADGTTVESCGELRAKGYVVPPDVDPDVDPDFDFTADDNCLCGVDVPTILAQQPERVWLWDPFGFTEDHPDLFRWWDE